MVFEQYTQFFKIAKHTRTYYKEWSKKDPEQVIEES